MQAIRALRETLGMNQQEFATAIGKSYPTVQKYERRRPPKGLELLPLLKLAKLRAEDIELQNTFRRAAIQGFPPDAFPLFLEVMTPSDVELAEVLTSEHVQSGELYDDYRTAVKLLIEFMSTEPGSDTWHTAAFKLLSTIGLRPIDVQDPNPVPAATAENAAPSPQMRTGIRTSSPATDFYSNEEVPAEYRQLHAALEAILSSCDPDATELATNSLFGIERLVRSKAQPIADTDLPLTEHQQQEAREIAAENERLKAALDKLERKLHPGRKARGSPRKRAS